MTFTQNLDTVNPLNAYNNNIVKFTEAAALYTVITVTSGSDSYSYSIKPINGEFYFDFKDTFKYIVNKDWFSDEFGYNFNDIDDLLFKSVSVEYKSYDNSYQLINTQSFDYFITKSVVQIDDYLYVIESFMHFTDINLPYTFDVFEGFPFDMTFFQKEPQQMIITTGSNVVTFTFGTNAAKVWRIPLVGLDGSIKQQYAPPNQLVLQEGVVSVISSNAPYPKIAGTINYHTNCGDGVYLKWLNTQGGWDYWLFDNKHRVTEKDNSIGRFVSGHDNIDNINSIESNLGQEYDLVKSLAANFLDKHQFAKVQRIGRSPKVMLWVAHKQKFVEVFAIRKSTFVANKQEGTVSFDIELTKRQTQGV